MADKILLEDDFYRVYKSRLDTYVNAIHYNGKEASRLAGNFSSATSVLHRYLVQNHYKEGVTEVLAHEMYDFYAGGAFKILRNYSYLKPERYPELARLHNAAEDARIIYNNFIWYRLHNYIYRIMEIEPALKLNKMPANLVEEARQFVALEDRIEEIRDNRLWEYGESGKKYWEECQEKERRHKEDFERRNPGYKAAREEAWENYQKASRHGRVSGLIFTAIDEEYGYKRPEPERNVINNLAGVYYDFIDYRERCVYEKQKSLNNLENYYRGIDKVLREIYPQKTADERVDFWYRHFKLPFTVYPERKTKSVTVEKPKPVVKPQSKVEVKPQVSTIISNQTFIMPNLSTTDSSLFKIENGNCKKYLGKDAEVVIPSGIVKVGSSSFGKAHKFLKYAVVPEGVKELGSLAFCDCVKLETVVLPSTLKTIKNQVFQGCDSLKMAVFPNGCKIGDIASHFPSGCEMVFKVEKPVSVNIEKQQSKEESLPVKKWQPPKELQSDFRQGNSVLKRYVGSADYVIVPDGITKMWYNAFHKAKDFLRYVVLPEGIVEIPDYAFEGCEQLETLELPSTLTKIGASAFRDCKKLCKINFPKSLSSVDICAFENCQQLKSVSLPEQCNYEAQPSPFATFPKSCNVKGGAIKQKIVEEKPKPQPAQTVEIKRVEKDKKVETIAPATSNLGDFVIEKDVLKQYLGKDEVVILPTGIKKIGVSAFAKNLSIKHVILPEGVKELSTFAFDACTNLERVDLPSTLKIVKNGVFCGCERLKDIVLPDGVKQIGGYAFNQCTNLEQISIPAGLEKILSFTFNNCKNLKDVRFTKNIKEIEYGAFDGCQSLKSVAVPKSCVLGRFIILGAFPEDCKTTDL